MASNDNIDVVALAKSPVFGIAHPTKRRKNGDINRSISNYLRRISILGGNVDAEIDLETSAYAMRPRLV
jgi:hypothetical protein